MERIRTILKSGVHNINLVAPDRRCTSRFRTELMKSSYKGLVIEETENLKADRKWCDLVVFSPNDEDLVSSLILLERIICPHGLSGSQARRLYETLARSALSPVCAKTIMREHRTGTFYRTREILASFSSCGLFIPVASADRKLYLIPYYYCLNDPAVLVVRHLMSLGWSVSLDLPVISARLGSQCLSLAFELAGLQHAQGRKILICEQPVLNFSAIRSYTLASFLDSSSLL